MHLTVGYLATPTGDDGVALASALAKTFDAEVDVVLVVRQEMPDGHPGRAEYQRLLVNRGEEWVSRAIGALGDRGVSANSTVLVGESFAGSLIGFAGSLIGFAEDKNSDLIVIGGARDGVFGGHVIGSVTGALLHASPIPVALAPRGYHEDPPDTVTAVTAAVPTRPGDDNPLPFAITLASAANLPIRMVSLVSAENLAHAESAKEVREIQIAAAEENLVLAARALPDAPEIESLVADGLTLESALKKLNWDDTDVLVVGSSRFAAPRRIFLGSTAARILAGTDAPVIVVPRDGG
jgi:nucleotide-binding universal stress UspA family protein